MVVWTPALTSQQEHAYACIVRPVAGCDDGCEVRIVGLPDEADRQQIMVVVEHRRGDDVRIAWSRPLPAHQGINPDVIAAVEALGALMAPLHGDGPHGGTS